jgi:hypothetical protein
MFFEKFKNRFSKIMKYKHYAILAGIAVAGMFAGIYARGYSDAKGWTQGTA